MCVCWGMFFFFFPKQNQKKRKYNSRRRGSAAGLAHARQVAATDAVASHSKVTSPSAVLDTIMLCYQKLICAVLL